MKNKNNNLENKGFYRLIKVVYIVCILIVALISVGEFFNQKPSTKIDKRSSYISCKKGGHTAFLDGVFNIANWDGYVIPNKASKFCLDRTGNSGYSTHIEYIGFFNWFPEAIITSFLIFIGGFMVLSFIKEVILYIAFGKPLFKQ